MTWHVHVVHRKNKQLSLRSAGGGAYVAGLELASPANSHQPNRLEVDLQEGKGPELREDEGQMRRRRRAAGAAWKAIRPSRRDAGDEGFFSPKI